MDLSYLREKNIERQKVWGGADTIGFEYDAIQLGEEAGEVLGAVKKYIRSINGIQGGNKTIQDIADELADVLISADLLARHFNIDLSVAVKEKFNKTSNKHGITVVMD